MRDKDRMTIGIIGAVVLHLVILAIMQATGFGIRPAPTPPAAIEVTFDDLAFIPEEAVPEEREPEPEPARQPVTEPEIAVAPEPEPPTPVPEPPAPQPPAPTPAPPADPPAATQDSPPPGTTQPAPTAPTPTPPAAPRPQDGGPTAEDLPLETTPTRREAPPRDPDLMAAGGMVAEHELEPDWWDGTFADRGTDSSQMEREQAEAFAERIEQDTEFDRAFREALARLDEARDVTSAPSRDTSGSGDPSSRPGIPDGPGVPGVEWSGAPRSALGPLPEIGLTARDFGGTVPPEVRYLIVFDVDAAGNVVPGSVVMQQRSGFTAADSKVGAAIRQWRFNAGRTTSTAVFPLIIRSDQIR